MNFDAFVTSMNQEIPPNSLSPLLKAMWYDGKGDWEQAHQIAQETNAKEYCWVHAYLHRKEGDTWNANYWYTRASKKMPNSTLEQEWEVIVKELLRLKE